MLHLALFSGVPRRCTASCLITLPHGEPCSPSTLESSDPFSLTLISPSTHYSFQTHNIFPHTLGLPYYFLLATLQVLGRQVTNVLLTFLVTESSMVVTPYLFNK